MQHHNIMVQKTRVWHPAPNLQEEKIEGEELRVLVDKVLQETVDKNEPPVSNNKEANKSRIDERDPLNRLPTNMIKKEGKPC